MALPLARPGGAARGVEPASTTSAPPRQLSLVPGRRRVAGFAIAVTVLVSAVMMGALYVHTRIAERQLDIDSLDRSLRTAQEEFDVLRSKRAELRSPTRLSNDATALGMALGDESAFIAVDPMVLAVTIARTGQVPAGGEIVVGSDQRLEPLDQVRLVKSVTSEAP